MLQQVAILCFVKCLWKWNPEEVGQSIIKDTRYIHKTSNVLFDYLALYIYFLFSIFWFVYVKSEEIVKRFKMGTG